MVLSILFLFFYAPLWYCTAALKFSRQICLTEWINAIFVHWRPVFHRSSYCCPIIIDPGFIHLGSQSRLFSFPLLLSVDVPKDIIFDKKKINKLVPNRPVGPFDTMPYSPQGRLLNTLSHYGKPLKGYYLVHHCINQTEIRERIFRYISNISPYSSCHTMKRIVWRNLPKSICHWCHQKCKF